MEGTGASDLRSSSANDQQADSSPPRKGDDYLAGGVYTDCKNLLENYLELKTSTFEDFVKLWKQWKFSEIFCGRETFSELYEFTEELFAISKTFILPPHSQIKRIGGLYLMYSLYTQQPTQSFVKYRITVQEWGVILKFIENLKSHGFIDANYIFHKLCLDGAFYTVFQTREFGLERNFRKYLMPWPARDQESQPFPMFDSETLLNYACRSSVKAYANNCRSRYNSLKQSLSGSSFQPIDGSDIALDVALETGIDNSVESADSSLFSDIGLKRRKLRNRAYDVKRSGKGNQQEKKKKLKPLPTLRDDGDESIPKEGRDCLIPRKSISKKKRVRRNAGKAAQDEIFGTPGEEEINMKDLISDD